MSNKYMNETRELLFFYTKFVIQLVLLDRKYSA